MKKRGIKDRIRGILYQNSNPVVAGITDNGQVGDCGFKISYSVIDFNKATEQLYNLLRSLKN